MQRLMPAAAETGAPDWEGPVLVDRQRVDPIVLNGSIVSTRGSSITSAMRRGSIPEMTVRYRSSRPSLFSPRRSPNWGSVRTTLRQGIFRLFSDSQKNPKQKRRLIANTWARSPRGNSRWLLGSTRPRLSVQSVWIRCLGCRCARLRFHP